MIQENEEFIKIKHRGQIFTPDYLVEDILNQGHYVTDKINCKHIIDNSCGDGQFMIHIVNRYCKDFLKHDTDLYKLKNELQTYIHAIEIDCNELEMCKERCEQVANIYGIKNVAWNFINADTLTNKEFYGKMDYVVGNPPYVRVHNLNEDFTSVKSYLFGNIGMTDLYIVFYEIGIKMLNDTGILAYITPSSFFTSVAGTNLRRYLSDNMLLESVCDLKHFQPFNATTYTAIVCLNKNAENEKVRYYEFDENKLIPSYVETLKISEYVLNGNFYFASKEKLNILTKIINNFWRVDVSVKNGYATLADDVFIKNFEFKSKFIKPVLKASRAQWSLMFYPYDENNKIICEDEIKEDEELYSYLLSMKSKLNRRKSDHVGDDYWYAFGRSQGINDTYRNKIAINSLIRTVKDLKIVDVPSGSGVYSGLYIISDVISMGDIKKSLLDEEFEIYVSLLGKYKSGGYYTFSSKDVKLYLDYKLNNGGLL